MRKPVDPPITHDELLSILDYDPLTGIFTWLEDRSPNAMKWSVAGCVNPLGYAVLSINNRTVNAHRLAWYYMTGGWPQKFILHKNNIRNDNRFSNLIEGTRSEAGAHAPVSKKSKSGYKGVRPYLHDKSKWWSKIMKNGVLVEIGVFDCKNDAGIAYNKYAFELYGEIAYKNIIKDEVNASEKR